MISGSILGNLHIGSHLRSMAPFGSRRGIKMGTIDFIYGKPQERSGRSQSLIHPEAEIFGASQLRNFQNLSNMQRDTKGCELGEF